MVTLDELRKHGNNLPLDAPVWEDTPLMKRVKAWKENGPGSQESRDRSARIAEETYTSMREAMLGAEL